MQTRWQSFFESCINVAIGYGVALMSQILIFPLFGIHIPLASNPAIGAIFTVISIARSYAVRRVFNRLHGSESMNCLDQTIGENFALYHGDCVEVLKGLPASSVHYSIFSPRSPASTPTAIARETWATAAATRNFSSTSATS